MSSLAGSAPSPPLCPGRCHSQEGAGRGDCAPSTRAVLGEGLCSCHTPQPGLDLSCKCKHSWAEGVKAEAGSAGAVPWAEQGLALGDQLSGVAGHADLGLTRALEGVQLLCCGCPEQTLLVPAQRNHTEFHLTHPCCPVGRCFRRQCWVHPSE